MGFFGSSSMLQALSFLFRRGRARSRARDNRPSRSSPGLHPFGKLPSAALGTGKTGAPLIEQRPGSLCQDESPETGSCARIGAVIQCQCLCKESCREMSGTVTLRRADPGCFLSVGRP
jgi:hypothetical protein